MQHSNCNQPATVPAEGASCPPQTEQRRADIIHLARQQYQQQGVVEIDHNAQLSEGSDNGCYVQGWVWVDFAGTGFDKEPEGSVAKEPSEPCPACENRGWVACNTGTAEPPAYVIQRCDACKSIDTDRAAVEAVIRAAKSQPKLLTLVKEIAGLTHEGEPGDDGQPYEPTSEDAIATVNELIYKARQVLGTAPTCSQCGQSVPYTISCPEGAKVCPDCFAAGQH